MEISLGQMGPAIQDQSLSEPSGRATEKLVTSCDIVYPCLSLFIHVDPFISFPA